MLRLVLVKILDDRPHARGMIDVFDQLVRHKSLVPRERRHGIVASALVTDAADDRRLVHPLAHQGQVFTDVGPGRRSRNHTKFAAAGTRPLGLHVVHVLRRSTTVQVQQDHVLGRPRAETGNHFATGSSHDVFRQATDRARRPGRHQLTASDPVVR